MILAGDLGGTKSLLALYSKEGPTRPRFLKEYPTRAFKSPLSLLQTYLQEVGASPETISLAVAGPVLRGRVHMVNVGWRFSATSISKKLGVEKTILLNDLEALAYAIPHLARRYFLTLKPGRVDRRGNVAVLAAGTGLGRSFLVRKHAPFPVPVATEGGHVEFAPWDDLTWEFHRFLVSRFGHASVERVVSGPGIENIYRFLCEKEGQTPLLKSAAEIGPQGLAGKDHLARRALELFSYAYGREAGNSALLSLATGGVVLAGGVTLKLLPFLRETPFFLQAFLDKGRLREFVEEVPVKVLTHPYPVLLGAALFAKHQAH
ncbi:MAG: glucokinase [Thermodesulfobacteria bacterium]|nr:glucokinase [Thermodesulfobacteriota bacterium]